MEDAQALSGTLPTQLGLTTALSSFGFDVAPRLSGTLPLSLGKWSSMQSFNLVATAMSGTLPTEFGAMTLMDGLTIGWSETENDPTKKVPCRISGTIPAQIAQQTSLRLQLELQGPISLSGTLPTQLGNMTNLQDILVDAPGLSGSLPLEMRWMDSLDEIELGGTRLSGTLAPELAQASARFSNVGLLHTRVSGTIPAAWALNSKLSSFTISPRQPEAQANSTSVATAADLSDTVTPRDWRLWGLPL